MVILAVKSKAKEQRNQKANELKVLRLPVPLLVHL